MPLFHLHIHVSAADGQRDEFERWYEDTHLDDVIRTTDGCWSAQRYWLRASQGADSANQHLAIYEVEADSADAVLVALNARRDERTYADGVLDSENVAFWIFEAAGPRHDVS